jgi:hypothetical protein
MKAKDFIEKRLSDVLDMDVIGYVTYPSTVFVKPGETVYDEDDEYESPKFSVEEHLTRNLYEKVRTAYNTLFQRVLEKAGRHIMNDNKSTIILNDGEGKTWFFHVHGFTLSLTDRGCRQGWDYEYDPMDHKQDQENWFSSKNLWF